MCALATSMAPVTGESSHGHAYQSLCRSSIATPDRKYPGISDIASRSLESPVSRVSRARANHGRASGAPLH